jgi:hypothetical protein
LQFDLNEKLSIEETLDEILSSKSKSRDHLHPLSQNPNNEIAKEKRIQNQLEDLIWSKRLANWISLYKNQKIQTATVRDRAT